jgi:3-deoxy-D-manno-octulosonate 8-phosphate phosphatase (KDO 8-P phosphatase)
VTPGLSGLKLAAFDVDGVLTDGTLLYGGDGVVQGFCARDGAGLQDLMENGLDVALISFRDHPATRRRAADLGISLLCLGSRDKAGSLRSLCLHLGIDPCECAFMGDDLRDIPALELAGVSACPSDADPAVREVCSVVTEAAGGRGAARELADMILGRRGL